MNLFYFIRGFFRFVAENLKFVWHDAIAMGRKKSESSITQAIENKEHR